MAEKKAPDGVRNKQRKLSANVNGAKLTVVVSAALHVAFKLLDKTP